MHTLRGLLYTLDKQGYTLDLSYFSSEMGTAAQPRGQGGKRVRQAELIEGGGDEPDYSYLA